MIKKIFLLMLTAFFVSSCATYAPQIKIASTPALNKDVVHSFYLIGDAGNIPLGETSKVLPALKEELNKASKNSTLIFLGNNISAEGFPKKKDARRAFQEQQLMTQTNTVTNFKGKTIFIPGNHDWSSGGPEGLKRQEKYIKNLLGKKTFLPEDGCPIEKIHISDDIELIIVDSQWYIEDWDNHPTINDKCEFKTRNDFLDEYESLIKKARGKTTIVTMHHPMYTNGPHGGQYSFGDHMKPVPVLGTLKNVIRKTSGINKADIQHKRYNELKRRLVTISQENKKVIFVSGHEQSLQYLVADNLHQIVSGSGSNVSPTRNVGAGQFSYGTHGFARLDVFKDGSSHVRFYGTEENKIVYETAVIKPQVKKLDTAYPTTFPKEKVGVIYTAAETDKSDIFKFLWGDRYRKLYSTPVIAPTVDLDTMYGGLKVIRKGGGNQSISLRLEDKNGAQYVMRALRKNAVQYLQSLIFKENYIEGQFDKTRTEALVLDVFAGSHPYAPFVTGTLSDAIGLYHTNPTLYYIPKQSALGDFNGEFGDALYMIEEHTSEGHSDQASFGFKDKIISTEEVMDKLHEDEDIVIDEAAYIRARLFDMLIGDWDRHYDQWRWIEFKENNKKVYRPLPRDRDQAFSIMSDGPLFSIGLAIIPTARILRKYDEDLVDVKGVNVEPYPLDMEFIQLSNKVAWDAQVKVIQNGITDAIIDAAFLNFPVEVRDQSFDDLKRKLKARRGNLQAISDRYYALVNKYAVIKGTNKDDYFTIQCLSNGEVKITAQRIQKGEKGEVFLERTYTKSETKEIWIYGLDDGDVFETKGKNNKIKIRLIGGQNNDKYIIPEGGKIVIYDYKSKKNDISQVKKTRIRLNDRYDMNVYDYKKLKNNVNAIIPVIGSNPDDGFKIGVTNINTDYGFERNPFTAKHIISASYYFATQGYDLFYTGEFANVVGDLNFSIDAQFNSPNYAINFFGYGNSTPNPEADDGDGFDANLDYNRVKIRTFKVMPSLVWKGDLGANIKAGIFYESNQVDRTNARFLDDLTNTSNTMGITTINESVYDNQDFYGVNAAYHFENKDDQAFPTLGMQLGLQVGYKNNVATNKGYGYVMPTLGFDYKLISTGRLVLATNLAGHVNLGDDFEFYQGATLGANTGLRGYRNERFTGKRAFVQTTDIRWNIIGLKTSILPLNLGVFGGADYGRIWVDDDLVFNPIFNDSDWNTSFGGGVFVNLAEMMTANVSAFNSGDGVRLAFKMGFGF
ncbi:MAG: hypothetical protein ACJA1Z_001191 [Patiriisocius sp.]|jgi:hypothetical protein